MNQSLYLQISMRESEINARIKKIAIKSIDSCKKYLDNRDRPWQLL